MIGHFPTPYPDELLYSISARFSLRGAYPSIKAVLKELFGASTATAVTDLPNRLGYLAAALPRGSSMTFDRLTDHHTLFPFFSAFLPPERVKQLRSDMKGSSGPITHMRSGIMAGGVTIPSHLKFCQQCKQEDETAFGETYWHRLHQLPGVEVCPSHQIFLDNSSVGLRAGRKHLQFISAGQATRAVSSRHVNIDNQDHRILLQLTHDAEWLLTHPNTGTSLKVLHTRFLRLMIERGLATYTGSIHVKRLLNEFSSHYSSALLKLLNCELRGRDIEKTNWLLRLVRPPKHAQHPLYHLLLIHFLGCTVKEFFQLPEEMCPFEEGPWPCLNPAADHYRQPVITECQLGDRLRSGKPTGRFSCACGFAYVRTGLDSSPEDRFRIGRMISFGQVWEAKLKQLWKDSSLTLSEMGRKLNVDPLTVRRHATRLKLSFSRSGKEFKSLNGATQLKEKDISAAGEKKRSGYRSKWLSAMKQERKITLKSLRRKLTREYSWLLQNDSEWLEGHKPRPQMRNLSTASVDWKKRDAEYAVAVKTAASRIKDTSVRLLQVTKTAIGRELGAVTLFQQKLHKLPLTAQILALVVETREEYCIRRIQWAAELFLQENLSPKPWQLISRANVYSLRNAPEIRVAIEIAVQKVESTIWWDTEKQAIS